MRKRRWRVVKGVITPPAALQRGVLPPEGLMVEQAAGPDPDEARRLQEAVALIERAVERLSRLRDSDDPEVAEEAMELVESLAAIEGFLRQLTEHALLRETLRARLAAAVRRARSLGLIA